MKINFNDCYAINYRRKIKKLFKFTMDKLGFGQAYSVNITFVDEDEIKELNKTYRNVEKVTDVLSFPLLSDEDKDIDYGEKYEDIGDIVICKSVAKIQAKEYGHSYIREVCFLSLHGLLHLLGYDHIEKQDEEKMTKVQSEILEELGIKR